MKSIKWLSETAFLIILTFPIALIPTKISVKIGKLLGLMVYYLWGSRRGIALDNIKKALEYGAIKTTLSPETMARESFVNMGRSFMEIIKIYYGFGKGIINSVEINGMENYMEAASQNKGIVFITGHCGNWELMAIAIGYKVYTGFILARAHKNRYLNLLIEKVRQRYGNKVIYKQGAIKKILTALKNSDRIGVLIDQAVFKEDGYLIDFLGRGAWTTKMPAIIARKTGAPLLPVFIHRDTNRHIINIHPAVELSQVEDNEEALKEDTKQFTGYIENYIKEYPDEWLWMHRRWKRLEG